MPQCGDRCRTPNGNLTHKVAKLPSAEYLKYWSLHPAPFPGPRPCCANHHWAAVTDIGVDLGVAWEAMSLSIHWICSGIKGISSSPSSVASLSVMVGGSMMALDCAQDLPSMCACSHVLPPHIFRMAQTLINLHKLTSGFNLYNDFAGKFCNVAVLKDL